MFFYTNSCKRIFNEVLLKSMYAGVLNNKVLWETFEQRSRPERNMHLNVPLYEDVL